MQHANVTQILVILVYRYTASQRCNESRGRFIAHAMMYKRDQFVWIDETGSDNRNFMRKYGYALCGQTPTSSRFLIRGDRISAVAAISCDCLTAVEFKTGTTNADFFYDFVRGSLIPMMHSFDGSVPKSILVLDNCFIHHVQSVVQLLVDTGILVLFLPPYSPDYNYPYPIEECFCCVKYYFGEHDALFQVLNDPIVILQSAFNSITSGMCNGWISHSGYC